MDEQQKQKALDDLELIKKMMGPFRRKVASSGKGFILFGVFWLVLSSIPRIPALGPLVRRAPVLCVTLWLLFVFGMVWLLNFLVRRVEKTGEMCQPPVYCRKQVMEIAIAGVAICFLADFVVTRLVPDPAALGALISFVILLVLGMMYYFMGVVFTWEFRAGGLLAFAGLVVIAYARGHETLVLNLTLGLNSVLVGCLLHIRWLKWKRQERSAGGESPYPLQA